MIAVLAGMIVLLMLATFLIWRMMKNRRDDFHNECLLAIFEQTQSKILQQMHEAEEPIVNIIILLNAAVDTYNEGLRGRDVDCRRLKHLDPQKYMEEHEPSDKELDDE